MRNKMLVAALAVALVAVFVGAVTLSAGASGDKTRVGSWGRSPGAANRTSGPVTIRSHEGGQTLIVREREVRSKFINVDGSAFGPGDYFLFKNRLLRKGVRVGRDNIMCTFHFPATEQRATLLCEGTFTFNGTGGIRRGKVEVAGTFSFGPNAPETQAIPITGGTGHYQNVRGEIHVPTEGNTVVLHLLP